MKRELLKEGMKCKITRQVDDAEGALYEHEVVTVLEWTDISTKNSEDTVVVFVVDEIGKHHTVGLDDLVTM